MYFISTQRVAPYFVQFQHYTIRGDGRLNEGNEAVSLPGMKTFLQRFLRARRERRWRARKKQMPVSREKPGQDWLAGGNFLLDIASRGDAVLIE
ncbi:MAG TPA: hypothetical protein VF458_16900 [Ktedonobacteraceae bacterium]